MPLCNVPDLNTVQTWCFFAGNMCEKRFQTLGGESHNSLQRLQQNTRNAIYVGRWQHQDMVHCIKWSQHIKDLTTRTFWNSFRVRVCVRCISLTNVRRSNKNRHWKASTVHRRVALIKRFVSGLNFFSRLVLLALVRSSYSYKLMILYSLRFIGLWNSTIFAIKKLFLIFPTFHLNLRRTKKLLFFFNYP